MYSIVLILHSWLRGGDCARAWPPPRRRRRRRKRSQREDRAALHDRDGSADAARPAALLLLSPNTTAMFADFGAAMRDPVARFWAVEHVTTMMVAVVFAHLGRVLARKAPTPAAEAARVCSSALVSPHC